MPDIDVNLEALADTVWAATKEPNRLARSARVMRNMTDLGLREIVPYVRRAAERQVGLPSWMSDLAYLRRTNADLTGAVESVTHQLVDLANERNRLECQVTGLQAWCDLLSGEVQRLQKRETGSSNPHDV